MVTMGHDMVAMGLYISIYMFAFNNDKAIRKY